MRREKDNVGTWRRRTGLGALVPAVLLAVAAACGSERREALPVDAGAPFEPPDADPPRDGGADAGRGADATDAGDDAALGEHQDCVSAESGCALVIDPSVGASTAAIFAQGTEILDRPRQPSPGVDYDTCYTGGPFPVRTYFAYVEVKNPGPKDVVAEIRLDTPPGGQWSYAFAAAYASFPTTTAERDACLTGLNGRCPDPTGLTEPRWPCLVGAAAPEIPSGGSVWIYVPLNATPNLDAGATPLRFVLSATVTAEGS
ncbi:MAG: hypothetical protein KIS78_12650 [Labilithrix sp.]|nr:hypothetical protein [Labilithrix sp.]